MLLIQYYHKGMCMHFQAILNQADQDLLSLSPY